MKKELNLGKDKIGSLLLAFSVPCIISMLINSIYNIVDQIFIGQGVGYLGNAATNVIFPIVIFCNAVAGLIGNGCAANLSLRLGEKKEKEASKSVASTIIFTIILGVVITLLLTGIVIALLLFYVNKLNTEISTLNANRKKVYVLSQDVKSGEEITEDMFALKAVDQTTIPANATSVISVIESWYMQTKDGTMLNRDEEGLYYTQTDANGSDSIVRVYKEDTTENYYIKPTSTTKQYIELNNVPVVAKLDMKKNTVVTPNMVQQTDNIVSNDVRVEEYNVVSLPVDLTDGDYVDIRLMLPNGQNYIVVSKKIVEIPMGAEGRLADTIRMTLREDEILAMSSAIVEAAGINGAKLYATKYKEAGIQDAAVPTYRPNDSVTALITDSNGNVSNPNIVSSAVEELKKRYTTSATNARRYLEQQIGADYDTNVKNSMEESISNAQDARQKYLDSLGE